MAKITLKGNPVHTSGELPIKGSIAPEFQLVNQDLENKSLKDFTHKKKLLYIVPSLDTSVCSTSSKKFNEFAKKHPNYVFLVISADLPFAQKRYCGAEGVHNVITLSMMRNKDFALHYGILIKDGPLAGICARAVLVLAENNTVQYSQLIPEITQEPDYDHAFKALAAY